MTRTVSVNWEYRCPFVRNAHEHFLTGLHAGAEWDVRFVVFSLGQSHAKREEAPRCGTSRIATRPVRQNGRGRCAREAARRLLLGPQSPLHGAARPSPRCARSPILPRVLDDAGGNGPSAPRSLEEFAAATTSVEGRKSASRQQPRSRVNRNRPGRFPNDALEYLIDRSRPRSRPAPLIEDGPIQLRRISPRMIRHRRQPGTESPATLSRGAPHRRRVPPSRRQASDQCWTPVEWIMYSTREGARSTRPALLGFHRGNPAAQVDRVIPDAFVEASDQSHLCRHRR